jgi:Do/DeqQ family serine protease
MKNIVKIVFISALGGALTLGGYKAFFEKPEVRTYIESASPQRNLTASFSPAAENSFVTAADKTLNSVVHVKTAVRSRYTPQSPLEFFFGSPAPRGQNGPLRMGTGSGVIISEDGYIVTNNHVIAKAEEILVALNDGEEFSAEVVGADPTTDIALLKIDAEALPYLEFSNSDQIQVGEWVLAVGNPFNLTSTVTAGIVSAKGRSIGIINEQAAIESFIQTDAAVNPGNSGGALVNTRGQLVGINSAISTHTGSFEGYSFAVPSNLAQKVVEDLKEYGTVQRAFLGVNIADITPRVANELEIERTKGVYIAGVTQNGAAAEAGIEKGDIIIGVDSREIEKASELQEAIGSKRPGEEVRIRLVREEDLLEYDLVLRNANGTTERFKKEDLEFLTLLGGSFRTINEKEKGVYGLNYGVRITGVKNGILADQAIPKGFIITQINQMPIRTIDDINVALEKKPAGNPVIILGVLPNGREKYYAFSLR